MISKEYMRTLHKYIWYTLILLAVLLACTKEVSLYTEVEFELLETHESEGFVNQGLATEITIVPEAELEGYEYSITYEVTQGVGHFEDVDGTRVEAGKGMLLSPYSTALVYIGEEKGVHSVKITGADNFGITEETEISYTLKDVPVTWTSESKVQQIELGEVTGITLTLGTPNNGIETTYEANYELVSGTGSIFAVAPNPLELTTDYAAIIPGTYLLNLQAEELGPLEIIFNLRDGNGQELKTGLRFEVVQTIDVIAIDLGPHDEIDMVLGDTLECPATFDPPNASDQGVDIVSSDPDVVLIDENNVCIAVSLGTAVVTATSTSNPEAQDSVTITVVPPARIPVTEIQVTQENPDSEAAVRQLIATVLPDDATDASVLWSSADEAIAKVDEIGLLTGLTAGTVLITATSVSDPDIKGTIEIEITEASVLNGTDVLAFELPGQNEAVIDLVNHIVTVNVADGTELNVAPTLVTISPGATLTPSAERVRDFNAAVDYTIRAGNGDEQVWTVNVTVSPPDSSTENDIVVFRLAGQLGASTIDTQQATVAVTVPDGTPLNVAPEQIQVSENASISPLGTTVRNFNQPVRYTVTAENGAEREWTITTTILPPTGSTANDITAFALPIQNSSSIDVDAHVVTINVADGTNLNTAPQLLEVSTNAMVSPAVSTVQDFSTPVLYTVTAENGDEQLWTVNVTVSPPSGSGENDIVAFELPNQNTSTINVSGHTVSINVAAGTSLNVAPGIFQISAGATVQPDITAVQDFSGIVTYTITAENGIAQDWQVQVTVSPDNTVPVITLVGSNPQDLTVGGTYVELGAIAADNVDGDISSNVIIDASDVDMNTPGDYRVTYNVSDAAGNPALEVVRTVRVSAAPDTTAPVISLTGGDVDLIVGEAYNDQGATATDNVDADITTEIVIVSTVDTNNVGVYSVSYNVSDSAGNAAIEVVRTVRVNAAPDTTPPVISLIGGNVVLTVGATYNDQGATAIDNVDGDITGNIQVDFSGVDTNTIGIYNVTYNVSDAAGNAAVEVIRTVRVNAAPDTTPPVITLTGANPQDLTVGGTYTELGATATDNVDGNLTLDIITDASAVNMGVIGTYQVTYNVSDAAGNPAVEVIRTVRVNAAPDTTPPVITLTGANPQDLTVGGTYTELGATATDNVDGIITAAIVIDDSAVNMGVIGTYQVTYNVSDAAGNPAVEVIRTVEVNAAPDTTPPVITLTGANPQDLTVGGTYTELGATATDNVDGIITAAIVIDDSAVNMGVIGTYQVTYNVSDAAGNPAIEVIRTVQVNAPANSPPVAQDDAFTVAENGTLNRSVLLDNGSGPDIDLEDDDLIVDRVNGSSANVGIAVGGSNGGLFTISAGGNLLFDPNGEFDTLKQGDSEQTTVVYRINDGNGGSDSATVTVTVTGVDDPNQAPLVNAGADQTITLPISSVTLSGNASDDGTISTYQWSKDSGGAASITSPSAAATMITGLVEGTYVFRLTATDDEGATGFDTVTVTVNADNRSGENNILAFQFPGLIGTATINTTSHTVTGDVTFGTNLVASPIALTVSTGATLSPSVNTVRDFSSEVQYTVTAENGDEQVWTITLTEETPLRYHRFDNLGTDLSQANTNFCNGTNVGTPKLNIRIASKLIVGEVYQLSDPEYTGYYKVIIAEDTPNGDADEDIDGSSVSGPVTVSCAPNTPPVAVGTAFPAAGGAPLIVAFKNPGSTDSDGTIVSTEYDFGDGSPVVSGEFPFETSHEYTAVGDYTATMTVTDNDGASSSLTFDIEVTDPPSFTFTIDPVPSPTNDPVIIRFRISRNQAAMDAGIQFEMSFNQFNPGDETPLSTFTYDGAGYFNAEWFNVNPGNTAGLLSGFAGANGEPYSFEFTVRSTNLTGLPPQTRTVSFEYSDGGPPD